MCIYNVLPERVVHVRPYSSQCMKRIFYKLWEQIYELSSALMFIIWNFIDKIDVLMAIDI